MQKYIESLSKNIHEPDARIKAVIFFLIAALNLACAALVFYTGGTKFSYLHLFYVPIIITGFYFGSFWGTVSGIISALLIGPFMPESFEPIVHQKPEIWVFRLVFFGMVGTLAGLFSELTKAYRRMLEQQYLTDPVTGLPNFRGLQTLVQSDPRGVGLYAGVIVIKVQHISEIDKSLGPDSAEKLLKTISTHFKNIAQDSCVLSRLSGAKFAMLAHQGHSLSEILFKCHEHLDHDFIVDGIPVYVEFYYGAVETSGVDSLNDLLKKAGIAADRSVDHNMPEAYYEPQFDEQTQRNTQLLREFKVALQEKAFSLNYQPKYDLSSGEIVGVEALVRWAHPQMGMISPALFMGLAEHTLLINPFTRWLIQEALTQHEKLLQKGYQLSMALNFSMKNLQDPAILEELWMEIERRQIPHYLVEIEITENAIAHNIDRIADILVAIQEKGVRIAVDDFGTGASSLKYLFKLPIDVLKIDQTFVQAMTNNSAAEAIVRSATTLGHELNLKVVAEGAETEEQFNLLKKIGCDLVQGYFIARPMPEELLYSWLDAKKSQVKRIIPGQKAHH